jgi:hypothetical protein
VAGLALPLLAGGHPERNFVPPGTQIQVQSDDPVILAHWDRGRIYPAHVASDVYSPDGNLAIPRGARCEMIVRQVSPGQLVLDLESVTVEGQRYVMDATGPQFTMSEEQFNSGTGLIGNVIGVISGDVQFEGNHIRVPARVGAHVPVAAAATCRQLDR